MIKKGKPSRAYLLFWKRISKIYNKTMQDFIDFKYGEESNIPGFYLKDESNFVINKLIDELMEWINFDELSNKDLIDFEFLRSMIEEILYSIEQNGSIHNRLINDANDLYISIRKNFSGENILGNYLFNASDFDEAFNFFYDKILTNAKVSVPEDTKDEVTEDIGEEKAAESNEVQKDVQIEKSDDEPPTQINEQKPEKTEEETSVNSAGVHPEESDKIPVQQNEIKDSNKKGAEFVEVEEKNEENPEVFKNKDEKNILDTLQENISILKDEIERFIKYHDYGAVE